MQAIVDKKAGQPRLRIEDMHVQRGDFALAVPEFNLTANSRVAIIGESGSGKTTFLELLGLLGWPDQIGRYHLFPDDNRSYLDLTDSIRSRDISNLSEVRGRALGFVLQDGGLIPYLSLRENAYLAAELAWGLSAEARVGIRETAATLGILDLLDRAPASLSGGQKQRGAVLRALTPGVRLLICDEPTAALDPGSSGKVMDALVRSAATNGAALVTASHNRPLMERFDFEIFEMSETVVDGVRRATLGPAAEAVRA